MLGGIGFTAAGIQLGPRDDVVGWSADARVANIGRVVCNHRFLLLPGVRGKGLASRVLRLATGRIADDWAEAYGERPVLVQSFTGPGQSGLSYRAAGWKCCPQLTSGRRSGVRRAVWLRPLVEGWQPVLCGEPERVLGWSESIYCAGGGAAREYGRSTHPDGRIRRRIAQMGAAWVNRLGEHLPSIFPGRAEQTAAYRLLSNEAVTMDHILDSHFEQTVERCGAERVVLAIQDTTTLNYDDLSTTSGLDELGGGGKGSAGILAHFGVGVNAVGRPLGMYTVDTDFRQADDKDSVRWVDGPGAGAGTRARLPGQPGGDGLRPRGRLLGSCSRVRSRPGRYCWSGPSRGTQRRVALASGGRRGPCGTMCWRRTRWEGRKIEVPACGGTEPSARPHGKADPCVARRWTCFPRRTGRVNHRSA